jgi:hypothetical protein
LELLKGGGSSLGGVLSESVPFEFVSALIVSADTSQIIERDAACSDLAKGSNGLFVVGTVVDQSIVTLHELTGALGSQKDEGESILNLL